MSLFIMGMFMLSKWWLMLSVMFVFFFYVFVLFRGWVWLIIVGFGNFWFRLVLFVIIRVFFDKRFLVLRKIGVLFCKGVIWGLCVGCLGWVSCVWLFISVILLLVMELEEVMRFGIFNLLGFVDDSFDFCNVLIGVFVS